MNDAHARRKAETPTGKRHYCTYTDRNYLVRALALCESLARHERRDYVLTVICLDELTRVIVDAVGDPNVVTVPLHELERGDEALLATRPTRSLVEYYWTLTPTAIMRLLQRLPPGEVLTYLDADLYFFSSPEPIDEELGTNAVLIHEHRFPPETAREAIENGRFNVGLLSFRHDARGLEVLAWWRERCLEWCYARAENGKMGDQKYLDEFPRFEGVAILGHVGAGLAPWNHVQYRIDEDAGRPRVNGLPVVFYHFHSLVVLGPGAYLASKHAAYPYGEEIIRVCYRPYVEALERQAATVHRLLPEFSFGLADRPPIGPEHTLLVRGAGSIAGRAGRPLADGWAWYPAGAARIAARG